MMNWFGARRLRLAGGILLLLSAGPESAVARDHIRELQAAAHSANRASWGQWGAAPSTYHGWATHSNRLIPAYVFGGSLKGVTGRHSPYRSELRLRRLYGRLPEGTLHSDADYFDQCGIHALQQAAVAQGKKQIILFVFDGLDWQTTRAAAIHKSGRVGYTAGRGTGLHFQDYAGAETDFGYFVCSPHNDGCQYDTNAQTVSAPGAILGGYDPLLGGRNPWTPGADPVYALCQNLGRKHAITDSAASATSLASGIKTYNDAINIDPIGMQVAPIAHGLQAAGWKIGVVTSVPISHATPACAYAQNVGRGDYQDLTRDMLGLRSISHKDRPLHGVDVLLGCGYGVTEATDEDQGSNFVPGNKYITDADKAQVDVAQSGRYLVVQRSSGRNGADELAQAARQASEKNLRLFGYFGATKTGGHLPFRTADGDYHPTAGLTVLAERYLPEDIAENPTLSDMTRAALEVLGSRQDNFWLMVEAGDVDWANHDNNLDNSIGAVISGDEAFRAITDWVESRDAWEETIVIVAADHGHYLVLNEPEALVPHDD